MNTKEITHTYRMNKWTEIIRECRASDQTVSAWCASHDINPKSYYYWLKRVREAACEALPTLSTGDNLFIPVSCPTHAAGTPSNDQGSSPAILLRLGSVTLEIYNHTSPTLIENTVRALQNVR